MSREDVDRKGTTKMEEEEKKELEEERNGKIDKRRPRRTAREHYPNVPITGFRSRISGALFVR